MIRFGSRRHALRSTVAAVAFLWTLVTVPSSEVHADGTRPLSAGLNADGQLGTGNTTTRRTPGPVLLTNIITVAAGREHAYALDDQARLWAWGDNSRGQLGDGSLVDRPTPVVVMSGVSAVAAGDYHGIALGRNGTVWTWGDGATGQLGLGDTAGRAVPTQVVGLGEAFDLAAGRDTSYVLLDDSTLWSFGGNTFGEVGDGTTTQRLSPVMVAGLFGVDAVAAGRNHGLAQLGNGSVWAWGANEYGQLGDGTTVSRPTPKQVLAGVHTFDAGADHTIAAMTDGTVRTWGRGYRGQLGLSSTSTKLTPQPVPGLAGIADIGVGRDQSFAIGTAGQVWAWGFNDSGQLGDGTVTQRNAPVRLNGLPPIVAADSGRGMTYFLPSSPPPASLPLASSNFGAGLAGFTAVIGMKVDSVLGAHSGAPSGRIATNNQAGSAQIALTTSVHQLCANVAIRIASMSSTAPFPMVSLLNAGGRPVAKLQLSKAGSMLVRTGNVSWGVGPKLAKNTWHRIALCASVDTAGQLKVVLNGATVDSRAINLGTAPVASVRLGEPFAHTVTMNWDDLLVEATF